MSWRVLRQTVIWPGIGKDGPTCSDQHHCHRLLQIHRVETINVRTVPVKHVPVVKVCIEVVHWHLAVGRDVRTSSKSFYKKSILKMVDDLSGSDDGDEKPEVDIDL